MLTSHCCRIGKFETTKIEVCMGASNGGTEVVKLAAAQGGHLFFFFLTSFNSVGGMAPLPPRSATGRIL